MPSVKTQKPTLNPLISNKKLTVLYNTLMKNLPDKADPYAAMPGGNIDMLTMVENAQTPIVITEGTQSECYVGFVAGNVK